MDKTAKGQWPAVTCVLYGKLKHRNRLYTVWKVIFRLWIGLRSHLRIQLKMCGPSLRNFKESIYSLKQLCRYVRAIWSLS